MTPKRYAEVAGDGGSEILSQVREQALRLRARLERIAHPVLVMSGKGGVGKSFLTANLAAIFARKGYRTGVLDADLHAPALARIMGVRDQRLVLGERGVHPAIGPLGIQVVSMALLLPEESTPLIWNSSSQSASSASAWQGTQDATALRELLADTLWGDLDFLFLDSPPGTDRLSDFVRLVPNLRGALVVTIPSQVSHLVAKKTLQMASRLGCRVLGVIENMSGYLCPYCHTVGPLFPAGEMGGKQMEKGLAASFLGRIPFDPAASATCDRGVVFALEAPDSPLTASLYSIAEKVMSVL